MSPAALAAAASLCGPFKYPVTERLRGMYHGNLSRIDRMLLNWTLDDRVRHILEVKRGCYRTFVAADDLYVTIRKQLYPFKITPDMKGYQYVSYYRRMPDGSIKYSLYNMTCPTSHFTIGISDIFDPTKKTFGYFTGSPLLQDRDYTVACDPITMHYREQQYVISRELYTN